MRSRRIPIAHPLPERSKAFSQYRGLLFLFLHFTPLRLGLFDDLLLQLPRYHIVVMHFHVEVEALSRRERSGSLLPKS